MLLKFSQYQKRSKLGSAGKPQRGFVTGPKKVAPNKGHRKGKGVGNKKVNGNRISGGRAPREDAPQTVPDPCDNSNDSGLGFDHQDLYHHHHQIQQQQTTFSTWGSTSGEQLVAAAPPRQTVAGAKRRLLDIKIESDDANDNFTFPHVHQQHLLHQPIPQPVPVEHKSPIVPTPRRVDNVGKNRNVGKKVGAASTQGSEARSRDGRVVLGIVVQPETQHRARYQTEGSRGAVKDTSGNSFPLVKLEGYKGVETAVLQVYIGTDQGKVAPHMFYQACKVSGKNSTPCTEKKINGTVVIEIEFNPSKDMLVLCDCVGILKERNVDVEHRFPEENQTKSRKKSTRCRMVFRTTITLPDGSVETLQVTSHPIVCTQPPGVPEICKKSLTSCPVTGGVELFIIGKNFLKDTQVRFSEGEPVAQDYWHCLVQPDKEFLHQSHLVCTVPRFRQEDIKVPVGVNVTVISGGKSSEPVPFVFTPNGTVPCHSLRPTPAYAMPQNIAQESPSLVQRIPDVAFPGQKIVLVPSGLEMGSQNVSGCLTKKIDVYKESEWLKTESVDTVSLLRGANGGLSRVDAITGEMLPLPGMAMSPPVGIAISPPIVGAAPQSLSLSPGGSTSDTPSTPVVLHSPLAPMVDSPTTSPERSPPLLQAMALTLPEQPMQTSPIVESIIPDHSSPALVSPQAITVEPQVIIEPTSIIQDVPQPMVLASTAPLVEPTTMMETTPNPPMIEGAAGPCLMETAPSTNNAMMKLDPSMETIEKFVSTAASSTPLPALNVERYFSHIENKEPLPEEVKVKYESSQPAPAHFQDKQVMEVLTAKEVIERFATKQVMEPFTSGTPDTFFPPADPKPPAQAPQLPTQPPALASVAHELTAMSETDLISYINPSCFDQV